MCQVLSLFDLESKITNCWPSSSLEVGSLLAVVIIPKNCVTLCFKVYIFDSLIPIVLSFRSSDYTTHAIEHTFNSFRRNFNEIFSISFFLCFFETNKKFEEHDPSFYICKVWRERVAYICGEISSGSFDGEIKYDKRSFTLNEIVRAIGQN